MKNYKLVTDLEAVVPKSIEIPGELIQLLMYIEDNGEVFFDQDHKMHVGRLEVPYMAEFVASGIPNRTRFVDFPQVELNRLCIFGYCYEGQALALWLDDNDLVKIVHIGCYPDDIFGIIGYTPIDFIKLLTLDGIISWAGDYNEKPFEDEKKLPLEHQKFRTWVKRTFSVELPNVAEEILGYPPCLDDIWEHNEDCDDFSKWYIRNLNKKSKVYEVVRKFSVTQLKIKF